MNLVQYISTSHVSKDMAKEHKRLCNKVHNIYLKDMTFDEVSDLLEAGCTIGRVGNKTSFVAIDIDKTSVNINTVLERYKDNKDISVSFSASNNPLKYHILVNLNREITREEYKDVLYKEFDKIKTELCAKCDFMELDKNAESFYQCFYGNSVDSEYEYVLENSRHLFKWTKKDEEPYFYKEEHQVVEHPSLNSADYCKKHGLLTVKETRRYDIFLPSMTKGRLKPIAEGYRFNWARMTGTKLLMRILYLNNEFNENWSKFDFIDTFEWIIRTNVVKPTEFEDDLKKLTLWLDNKWDIAATKSYEEQKKLLEPYFDCSKRQYKSRNYNATVMTELINEHMFDENTILFVDKDELKEICERLILNYYGFINYVKACHFELKFECETQRSNKGKCLEGYEVINNSVSIPKDQVTNAIRKYCSLHKIKIQRI